MENLLFAFLSIVILLPILYFLPIGFTNRGKIIIAGASFFIVLLGLMAAPIFPLWQTLLIEFLLVGISAYLLGKKLGTRLYLSTAEGEAFEEEVQPISTLEQLTDTYSYIATSDRQIKQSTITREEFPILDVPKAEPAAINGEQLDLVIPSILLAEEEISLKNEEIIQKVSTDSDLATEGYLAEIEQYLTNETESDDEDLPISLSVPNDLDLGIIEAAASIEEPENLFNDELDNELPELTFNDLTFELEQEITEAEQEGSPLEVEEMELEELFSGLDEIEIEENESKESPIKIELNLEDDDDAAFWKMLLEVEDEKKESTTTDKLERVWERTGLAK